MSRQVPLSASGGIFPLESFPNVICREAILAGFHSAPRRFVRSGDGEIVCLDKDGQPRFADLLRCRSPQYFYAFDLLWLNGRDLRELPLVERKRLLRRIIPNRRSVLFAKHVEGTGVSLFHAACEMDLEGIVAKWKSAPYRMDGSRTSWVKIKNPHYSQAEGRGELFEKFHSPHDTSRLVQQQAAGAKEKRGTSEGAQ